MSELERGRYRLTEMPDSTLLLTRAVDTCQTCKDCGCGTQGEPVVIPAVVGKVLTGKPVEMAEIMGLAASLPAALKGFKRGRGTGEDGGTGAAAGQSRRAARRDRRRAGGVGLPDQEGNSAADPGLPGLAAGSTTAGG